VTSPLTNQPFIPLVDLKAQMASIRAEVDAAMGAALDRCDFILGQDVGAFEEEFAAFSDVGHAIGCANGTDALYLALHALGIGPGDEVIVPAMTFIATALGVSMAGATPVLVDVEADTALIDPTKIEAAITPATKAIIPVHLFGQCADMDAIMGIAERRELLVLEDAAQAHGAEFNGKRAGSMGHAAGFSFYPGKNLGAYGDGGIITTNDDAANERIRFLRNWGSKIKYHHEEIGVNSRLDTVQAAILRIKLSRLDEWNAARCRHAAAYNAALADIPGITLTRYAEGMVYHLYVIRTERRDELLAALNDAGIGAGIHYPFAVHELKAYQHLDYAPGAFPVAEDWARRCLSLPIYAELPDDAVSRSAEVIRRFQSPA
jgi:dTDP-4-amino-4,6-dideoxygalactose transaminase